MPSIVGSTKEGGQRKEVSGMQAERNSQHNTDDKRASAPYKMQAWNSRKGDYRFLLEASVDAERRRLKGRVGGKSTFMGSLTMRWVRLASPRPRETRAPMVDKRQACTAKANEDLNFIMPR